MNYAYHRRAPGFTLVELLVVIAILALLLSILLPSLREARESARITVCRSNMRQMILGVRMYADDHRGSIFPVNPDLDDESIPPQGAAWARLIDDTAGAGEGPAVKPGLLYEYVSNVDDVTECPSNWRDRTGHTGDDDEDGPGMFGTPLDFDYTMVMNVHGLRIDRHIEMGYLDTPEEFGLWAIPPMSPPENQNIIRLSGLPIFVEENTRFWNQQYVDGLWGNGDQLEERHRGQCHLGFSDGRVEPFTPIMGKYNEGHEERDLDANDFYVRAFGRQEWIRLERQVGTMRPFGWINSPTP
jgi:prepilin-type N-terminal cleavage/methylation domain-containing protein